MYRTLPTSMESSTATNSSFPAKLLLVTQLQWISVPALWMFRWCIQYSIQSIHFQFWLWREFNSNSCWNPKSGFIEICCWNASGSIIENGWSGGYTGCIPKNTTTLEHWFVVVVSQSMALLCRRKWLQLRSTSIDVGNILWIFYDCLCWEFDGFFMKLVIFYFSLYYVKYNGVHLQILEWRRSFLVTDDTQSPGGTWRFGGPPAMQCFSLFLLPPYPSQSHRHRDRNSSQLQSL